MAINKFNDKLKTHKRPYWDSSKRLAKVSQTSINWKEYSVKLKHRNIVTTSQTQVMIPSLFQDLRDFKSIPHWSDTSALTLLTHQRRSSYCLLFCGSSQSHSSLSLFLKACASFPASAFWLTRSWLRWSLPLSTCAQIWHTWSPSSTLHLCCAWCLLSL